MQQLKQVQKNESLHSTKSCANILKHIKDHLGIILVAEAGHGKSYTGFTLVKEAMKDPDTTVIVLSPSTIWRRNFGFIRCVKVGTHSFNPIRTIKQVEISNVPFLRDTIHVNLDKKYTYIKSQWFENLLRSKNHLLFEIKYRNGRRIKHFESIILRQLYEMQEREIDKNKDYNHHYIIVLEELQNSFGSYSMNSDSALSLMTFFSQSRSDALIHYIGIGQRLNDISAKVVERLRVLCGLTLGENSLRKLKAMMPDKATKARIQQLPKRHWIYLDGQTNPEIIIPTFKKEGEIVYLKPPIPQQPKPQKKKGFLARFFGAFLSSTENRAKNINIENSEYPDPNDSDLIEFEL